MARPITMPKLGQSEERVTLARWLKKQGDSVLKGDVLFEIETDKSLHEVESFFQGTLLRILVAEGTTVPVQTTVAFVGDPGDPIPEVGTDTRAGDPGQPSISIEAASAGLPGTRSPTFRPGQERLEQAQRSTQSVPPMSPPSLFRISPRAARLAKEAAISAAEDPDARLIARYEQKRVTPPIPLGTRGKLGGDTWEVIGYVVRRTVADEVFAWSEYLLHSPTPTFFLSARGLALKKQVPPQFETPWRKPQYR